MLQSIAWQLTTVCVILLVLVFGYIAMNANSRSQVAADSVARARSWVFWVLVVIFVPTIGYTLTGLPYSPPNVRTGEPVHVNAVGHQWRWEVDPAQVPSRRSIEFHVTSADVNHGFAIYDADLKVVAQTQAMPGYTNVLHVNFDRPGTYRVLCLEYCGLAHHSMMTEITVTESD